ncbi:MAG TPA: ATP-binding protein, partial [Candidatus Acidoferrum sp.]
VWFLAQCLATFYDGVLHKPIDQPWPSDLLFFVWMTPAFLSLFVDPHKEPQQIRWTQWLDFAQVGILVVSLYIFAFEIPNRGRFPGFSIEILAFWVSVARNIFVVTLFAAWTLRSQNDQLRSLYRRTTAFLLLYSLAECPYLYLQVYQGLRPGTLWDLPFSLAFALAAILMATSNVKSLQSTTAIPRESPKTSPLLSRFALRLVPFLFPMAILLMAAHIAEQQFAIAVCAVIASFACSSARIVLSERQQLRTDTALQERNALLKSVFDGTGDAIFVKDQQGRYLIVNQAVANFLNKPIEQIIGKTAFDVADQQTAQELTKDDLSILQTGKTVTVDFQMIHEGATRYFLVTRAPYRDSNGQIIGVIGITRDISQYRAIEARLRQSQKMEAIGTLAGGVAHDFNNILMVVTGYSSVLAEALRSNPQLHGHVEQIQKAAERATALTRQLLAFSRKQTIQPVKLNLNDVVTAIEKFLHRLIGENIVISSNLAPTLGTVLADPGQIEQVILNLAVNARDAMPDGGKLSIQTRNTTVRDPKSYGQLEIKPGEYVELSVGDSGVGIEPSAQPHIFEPFFTTKPAGKGTGLGLSTVYGIVQQAGGFVTFQSAPGTGTTFRMLLPRIESAIANTTSPTDHVALVHGGETVLLVEDDASVCELVQSVLVFQGYSVLAARRPFEAEAMMRSHSGPIHLLLSDVILPGMSGADLARRLIAINPHMRVLFMSGYIDDSAVRLEIRERGTAYLQKPFSPKDLIKKVREVLDSVPAL